MVIFLMLLAASVVSIVTWLWVEGHTGRRVRTVAGLCAIGLAGACVRYLDYGREGCVELGAHKYMNYQNNALRAGDVAAVTRLVNATARNMETMSTLDAMQEAYTAAVATGKPFVSATQPSGLYEQ